MKKVISKVATDIKIIMEGISWDHSYANRRDTNKIYIIAGIKYLNLNE